MALQLTIIKVPPGVNLSEDRKTIGAEGGVIGRGVDNDWVLSDPERFLSSRHCEILKESAQYYLVDLSTNGTFVNGSQEPLGRGQRIALNDGDSFDVGDYRFKVSLANESSSFPDAPFGDSPNVAPNKGNEFIAEPDKPVANDIYLSNQYGGEVNDILPDAMKANDPLVALDNAHKQSSDYEVKHADSDLYGPGGIGLPESHKDALNDPPASMEDSANRLQDSLDWPVAKSESGLLPEDWDRDLSLLRKSRPRTGGPRTLNEDSLMPNKGSAVRPGRGKNRQSTEALQPAVDKHVASSSTSRAKMPSQPVRGDEPPAEPKKHTEQSQVANAGPSANAVDRSLLDSLGLDHSDLSDDQIREISATIGLMMRETLDGLMQILRSRASIKNEFRINITTIQPVENNPIKFSANVDEMIELMFLRRSKAYKAPLDAVRESFNTIADHQLAVIAGIRSAFRSALGKFDPLILEEEFKQKGKSGVLPGLFKGSMWAAYQEHYQSTINDMERSFQELFGDEFVQAYEDQLRKLEHARKRDV